MCVLQRSSAAADGLRGVCKGASMALGALRMGLGPVGPVGRRAYVLRRRRSPSARHRAQAPRTREGAFHGARPSRRSSERGFGAPAEVDAASKYSAIVVDANSGREIYGVNENALRHPASVTKVMTLYLLFEQLDKRGNLTLSSRISISEHAAAPGALQARASPAGETISGRRRHQGHRHALGQRHGGRGRGGRRPRRKAISPC